MVVGMVEVCSVCRRSIRHGNDGRDLLNRHSSCAWNIGPIHSIYIWASFKDVSQSKVSLKEHVMTLPSKTLRICSSLNLVVSSSSRQLLGDSLE
jgi:hypothetical protein